MSHYVVWVRTLNFWGSSDYRLFKILPSTPKALEITTLLQLSPVFVSRVSHAIFFLIFFHTRKIKII
jgi:hypothetical protein